MANEKQAIKRWVRAVGEPAGTKGFVNDFLSPEDLGHKHPESEGRGVHRTLRIENGQTRGAV